MQFLKINFCKFLGILTILMGQNILVADYKPASISGKYKMGTINSEGFCYPFWMDTTMASNYGSTDIVRESFAPSAMVDSNGDLYAISLWGFGSSEGPSFCVAKYVDGSRSTDYKISPWTKIPGVSLNCTSTPSFGATGVTQDAEFFKEYIHNAFMPCLAQEVNGGSDYIYGFVYIPPTRYMNATCTHPERENGSTEGMLFFKLKKNGLSSLETTYTPHKTCRIFQFDRLFPRTVQYDSKNGTAVQPQCGNFKACYNSKTNMVYLYHSAYLSGNLPSKPDLHQSIFTENGTYCSSVSNIAMELGNLVLPTRFIQCGNYIYFMSTFDGYVPKLFMQSATSNSLYLKINSLWCLIYLDGGGYYGGWTYSRYDYDFLVLDARNGENKIWCVLCFQGQNMYSGLTGKEGWSSTYCNFSYSNASLLLWSFPITSDTISDTIEDPEQKGINTEFNTINRDKESGCTYKAYPEYIQNVIYTTECGSNSALNPTQEGNIKQKLYLNTQKVCTYKNYIIYAYCYRGKGNGKGNHLYIGYAPYSITSTPQLRLLTKTEFKDANDNSFITDCSRIISLDCKNGHIWLTYLAKNNGNENSCYKYFHIKASDLVGE